MKTAFWLFGQFESATLTIEQVAQVIGKAEQTIRNRASAGTFPRPTADGVWLLDDIANWIDKRNLSPARAINRTENSFGDLTAIVARAVRGAVRCDQPLVYLLLQGDDVVYVGLSRSHITRFSTHQRDGEKEFDRVALIACEDSELEATEARLISLLKPRYNVQGVPK